MGKHSQESDRPPHYDEVQEESSTAHHSSPFAFLTGYGTDGIHLRGFSAEVVQAIHETIILAWPRGIQAHSIQNGIIKFKLRGLPWIIVGSSIDASLVDSRKLICALLKVLFDHGWLLEATTRIGGTGHIFRRSPPSLPSRQWFSMHFCSSDKVAFIDAPGQLCSALHSVLSQNLQSQDSKFGTYVLKLKGYPFSVTSNNENAKRILLHIRETIDEAGFQIYTTFDPPALQATGVLWICCSK